MNHRQRAAHEIAEAARKVAVRAFEYDFVVNLAVLPERHLAQEEVAHGVRLVVSQQDGKLKRVAERLRSLAPRLVEPEAVCDDCAREFYVRRHEHRGPQYGVLSQNVFANEVQAGPKFREQVFSGICPSLFTSPAERRDVVEQRVEPDVDGMPRVVRNRNRPTDGCLQTAYRNVFEAAAYEADDLISAHVGQYEVGPGLVEFEQRFVVIGEAEEIALLGDSIKRPFVYQAERRPVFFRRGL